VYEDYARDSRVRRHVRALAGAGYDVRVLALGDAQTVDVAAADGARLSALVGRKYRGASKAAYVVSYTRFAILVALRVVAALPRGLAAVWVNNPPDLLVFAVLPAKLGRVPILLDVHDMSSDLYAAKFGAPGTRRSPAVSIVGWVVRIVEDLAYRIADALLTVHGSYAERIRARVGRGTPVTDVLNVPDAPGWIEIGDGRDPTTRTPGRLVLGHHGTIAARFGVDLAVRAVRALVDDGLDVELRILGDGDAAGGIEPLVLELDLEERVRHDRRTFRPEEIPAFLGPVDVLVAPYRRSAFVDELLPVKILEAVVLGTAVVATSTRALRRHLGDDVITYLDEPTVEAIAAAIRPLAEPAERARRWRAGRTAARTLAWEPQRERLLSWFGSVARR
jgi:glycosyltransferase involved in cell wall biosynthesis